MSKFKPLLADDADLTKLSYPVYVSPKLDGIRAIVIGGVVMSRSLKPIPSAYVQRTFGRPEFEGLDGELIAGAPNSKTVYNDTYRAVMKSGSEQPVSFYVFDDITNPNFEYAQRYAALQERTTIPETLYVHQVHVGAEKLLLEIEQQMLDEGFEGLMLRKGRGPQSYYKFGRSTVKEGTLLKLKRFVDDEAEIIGFDEEMANHNEATKDELGNTKRSSHQENKVGKGRLGALVCKTKAGVEFRIGTGYTAELRQEMWDNRTELLGKLAKYKHFAIGAVEAPRFPVFLGMRAEIDS